jgi:hypothetical protein
MNSLVSKLLEWTLAGIVGGIIALLFAVFWQKPLEHLYSEVWLRMLAEPIVFESTKVSGCSGGNLGTLVQDAQNNGLQVDSQISNSFLCTSWDDKAYPRRILEDIAIRFDKCFTIDSSLTTPIMKLRSTNTAICTANVELDETNQWKSSTLPKYLCYSEELVNPKIMACSTDLLKSLGFQR